MEPPEHSVIRYELLDIADDFLESPTRVEEVPRVSSTEPVHIDRMTGNGRGVSRRYESGGNEQSLLDAPIVERTKSWPENLLTKVMPTGRPMIKRQFMKPSRFDGSGSLESFLKQFEVCANHNQWSENERTDFLQCALDKSAAQLLWDFGSRVDITYEELTERLRQRYGLESQAETFRTQLRCRRQKDRESLADLLHDVRRLVTLAYPAPASETTELIARDAFLDAMADSELSLKVREREPKSLDETFRTAVRLETYKRSLRDLSSDEGPRRDSRRQVRATKQEDTIAELAAQMKDMMEAHTALAAQVKDFMEVQHRHEEHGMKPMERKYSVPQWVPNGRYPTEHNRGREQGLGLSTNIVAQQVGGTPSENTSNGGSRTVRCYNCQRLGHLSKNCRAPRKNSQGTSSVNYNTTARSAGFENSQSLYVRGRINNQDCLCLIDTGSEINLLPAFLVADRFLDKTKRKLYAANGSEIRVKGEISLNVQFNKNCRRMTTFVVSEQVNETMLGMEFMSNNKCGLSFAKGKLFVGRCQLPLIKKDGAGWCRRVHITESVEIPPFSELNVPSKIVGQGRQSGCSSAMMIEHQELFPGIHTARVLLNEGDHDTVIRIMNTRAESATINEQELAGVLHPVEILDDKQIQKTLTNPQFEQIISTLLDKVDPNLSEEGKQDLKEMLREFPDVFSQDKNDLGCCEVSKHCIDTGSARPVRQPLRSQPQVYREFIDETVEQMIKDELIEPAQSEWAANVVLVKKKDGTLRFCLDYRSLNAVTRCDAYPLPKINDCLDALSGAKWFSTLDLTSGYHQIAMNDKDADKTAFVTRKGSFRWKRMPMGLSGATATFQRTMDMILTGLNFSVCLVYLDDVIIFAQSPSQHIHRLKEVFTRLRQAHLKLKVSKCRLMSQKVDFLGHVVSSEGVSVDPTKIEKVRTWPVPKNIKELRAYMGLCSYYRRFVLDFANESEPLSKLTRKGVKYVWTSDQQEAFENLKQKLMSAPILGLPNDDDEFIIDTDASEFAIGAVLSQRQKGSELVLAYGSRLLSTAERNYCTTRRELLSVVYFLKY